MAEDLDNLSEQFNEKEPRAAAFKALFNVLQTSTYDTLSGEGFSKGFPTYPEEFIFEANTIKTALSEADIVPSRTRTWVTGSLGSTSLEKLITGEFSTSISSDISSNPYVEKIICPLTKVQGTKDQFYFVFGKENITSEEYSNFYENAEDTGEGYSGKETAAGFLFDSQSAILKNFINPFKFGKGYNFKLYSSLNPEGSSTAYETFGPSQTTLAGGSPVANQTSGLIFDYREGGLFVASQPTNNEDPNLSNLIHPLWVEAYRYYGPVGVSGPQHTITASNVQIDNNLNVDGAISLQGLSFASVDSFTTSGSSTFGDNVDLDTHEFTGSVSITGSLFATASHALTASFATNAGQSGITSIMISSSLHDEVNGDYDITTLTPTDGEDIIEYKPTGIGFLVSSSIGSSSYITLIGSKSATTITKPNRGTDSSLIVSVGVGNSINDMPSNVGWNGGDIFQYTHQDKDYPDFSSYGAFHHTESLTDGKKYTTQSFSFPTPTKIDKIGLWYSRGSTTDPRQDFTITDISVDPYVGTFNPASNYIDEIQLSGSTDGTTWVGLLEKTNMNAERTGSNPIISSSIIYTGDSRWPNSIPSIDNGIGIVHFTSSKLNVPEYQYYKLHAHGGAANLGVDGYLYQYIHHLDIYQDKNFGENNRKQINIGFDHSTQDGEPFTNFQLAVSSAAGVLGFEGYTLPENQAVVNGIAQRNVDMNNNDLLNVDDLGTDSITTDTLTVNNTSLFNGNIDSKGILEQNDNIYMGFDPSGFSSFPSQSIVLKELNPIYFTNQKQNGDLGVDQFSAKIFGHYTNEGVSDLYLDAFRIYKVADKEIRFTTLHPEGTTIISSSQTLITSSVTITGPLDVHGEIRQNGTLFSGGGGGGAGSGFPHNQLSTGITASITGSLTISGSEGHLPFIEFGNINEGSNLNIKDDLNLYVMNSTLYFGDNPLGSADPDATSGTFTGTFSGPLTGNVTGDLTGTASRADSSSVAISSSYALSSSYAVSASFSTTSSYAITSSYAVSASFATTSSYAVSASHAITSSYISSSGINGTVLSASYAETINSTILKPLTIGTSGNGHDVTFFGSANGKYFKWDVSENLLEIKGKTSITGSIESSEDITIGRFDDDNDHFLNVRSKGGSVNHYSGIKLKHATEGYGFTIQSQDGIDGLHGLNILRHEYNNSGGIPVLFIPRSNGNVGIGTTSPIASLDITGDLRATSHITSSGNILSAGNIKAEGYVDTSLFQTSNNTISFKSGVGSPDGSSLKKYLFLDQNDNPAFEINQSGYFIISGSGDDDPRFIMRQNATSTNVNSGPIFMMERTQINTDDTTIGRFRFIARAENSLFGPVEKVYAEIHGSTEETQGGQEGGKIRFRVASHDAELVDGLIIEDGDAEDEVDVTIGNGTNSLTTVSGSLTILNKIIPNNNTLSVEGDNENGDISLEIRNNDLDDEEKDNTVSLKFGLKTSDPAGKIVAGKDSEYTTSPAYNDSNLQFYTTTNNTDTEKMRITSDGIISIGNDNPANIIDDYKLVVSGSITATNKISASGHLFASTSNAGTNLYQTVLVDTSSGQFYFTGSYGGGGGTTTIIHEGGDDDWGFFNNNITSSRSVLIKGLSSRKLRFNISQSTGPSTNLGHIEFTNERTLGGGGPLNSNPLAMIGAQSTQVQSDGIGGTELFFRATKNDSTTSDLIMKINSDEGVTIDNKLKVSESIQIGDFGSGDKDSFLKIQSDGGDTYHNLSGIQLRHDTNLFGFTIQSQDGPADTNTRHGLNIISHATTIDEDQTSLVNSRLFIDRVDGNVGIGTINPLHKLEVSGGAKLQQLNLDSPSTKNAKILFENSSTDISQNDILGTIEYQSNDGNDLNTVAKIKATATNEFETKFMDPTDPNTLLTHVSPTKLEFETSLTSGSLNGTKLTIHPSTGVSSSGHLHASTSLSSDNNHKQLLVDTTSGKFFHGSVGASTLLGRNISTKTLTGESTNPIVNTNQNQYQPVRVRKSGTDYDLETSITLQGSGIVNLLVSAMISVGNVNDYNTMQTQIQYSTTNGDSWLTEVSDIPGYSTDDDKNTLLSFCNISPIPINVGSNLSVGDIIKVRIQLRNLSDISYYINRSESGGITGISYLTVEEVGSVSSTTI